jgi:hypothetical protein
MKPLLNDRKASGEPYPSPESAADRRTFPVDQDHHPVAEIGLILICRTTIKSW